MSRPPPVRICEMWERGRVSETTTKTLQYRFDGPEDAPVLILGPSLGTTWHMWDRQVPELARQWRVLRFDLPGHGGAPALSRPGGLRTRRAAAGHARRDRRAAVRVRGLLHRRRHRRRTGAAQPGPHRLARARRRLAPVRHRRRVPAARRHRAGERAGPDGPDGARALVHPGLRRRAARDRRVGRPDGPHHRPRLLHRRLRGARRLRHPGASSGVSPCRRWCSSAPRTRSRAPPRPAPWSRAYRTPGSRSSPAPRTWRPSSSPPPSRTCSSATSPPPGSNPPTTRPRAIAVLPEAAPSPRRRQAAPVAEIAPAAEQPQAVWPAPRPLRRGPARSAGRCSGTRTWTGPWPQADEFSEDFQEFITRYAWGEIWTGPAWTGARAAAVTLTALVAGGHLDELAFHTRAALRNGLSPVEIKEVLIQTAVYCGVPGGEQRVQGGARGDPARRRSPSRVSTMAHGTAQ